MRTQRSLKFAALALGLVAVVLAGQHRAPMPAVHARFQAEAASMTPVVVLNQTRRHFGSVPQGTILRAEFVVRNAGTRRLIVNWDECACTLPTDQGPIIVEPGGAKAIPVQFETSSDPGAVEYSVDLVTNDPARPRFSLCLSAEVTGGSNTNESAHGDASFAPLPPDGSREIP